MNCECTGFGFLFIAFAIYLACRVINLAAGAFTWLTCERSKKPTQFNRGDSQAIIISGV